MSIVSLKIVTSLNFLFLSQFILVPVIICEPELKARLRCLCCFIHFGQQDLENINVSDCFEGFRDDEAGHTGSQSSDRGAALLTEHDAETERGELFSTILASKLTLHIWSLFCKSPLDCAGIHFFSKPLSSCINQSCCMGFEQKN